MDKNLVYESFSGCVTRTVVVDDTVVLSDLDTEIYMNDATI